MDKLNQRQLTLIKRAAEDAIHACNRHYKPFIDVVAHPFNIVALVEMAQSQQTEINQLQSQINEMAEVGLSQESAIREKDKRIKELESRLKAVHALAQMRSAVINADRWVTLRPHIKNAIKCLDRKEKALRGEHE